MSILFLGQGYHLREKKKGRERGDGILPMTSRKHCAEKKGRGGYENSGNSFSFPPYVGREERKRNATHCVISSLKEERRKKNKACAMAFTLLTQTHREKKKEEKQRPARFQSQRPRQGKGGSRPMHCSFYARSRERWKKRRGRDRSFLEDKYLTELKGKKKGTVSRQR